MGELNGKVAIVTGASKGIGAAIARTFAKAGAAVAVNYASNKADADRVVAEIVKAGGKAIAIQADVAKRADVQRLFQETAEKLGRPSILVNNAGVYSFAPLEAVTEEDFHRQFNTNVLGAILATQEAVKAFDGVGRQRDQPQDHREHEPVAEHARLFRLEERDRHDHARTRHRAGGQEYSGQRDRARHDRDRRLRRGGFERRVGEGAGLLAAHGAARPA